MKAKHQKLTRQLNNNQRGATLIVVVIFAVALFGFAALSLDVARVLQEQRHANAGTDAAALAGLNLLTGTTQDVNAVIKEAKAIAGANGVTTAEIASGARKGFLGQVQVGIWSNSTFQAKADSSGRYSAVRVPARRTVDLYFAKVVGLKFMSPAVSSVAALVAVGCVTDSVPFLVTLPQLAGKGFGDSMTLHEGVGSGNWGKIDIANYQNSNVWLDDMVSGGCGCQVCVGNYPTIQGDAKLKNTFDKLKVGSVFTMPVADNVTYGGNSDLAIIVGFVRVRLTSFDGTGNAWTATVTFLEPIPAGPGGGSCPPPCERTRLLVE